MDALQRQWPFADNQPLDALY